MPAFAHLVSMPARFLAEPVVQLLQTHGINAFIHCDDAGGVDPAMGMVHGAQIRVVQADLAEAKELLTAYQRAPLVDEED